MATPEASQKSLPWQHKSSRIPRRVRSSDESSTGTLSPGGSDNEADGLRSCDAGEPIGGEPRRRRRPQLVRAGSVDALDANGAVSIDDLLHQPPQINRTPVTQLNNGATTLPRTRRSRNNGNPPITPGVYRAIKDYEPQHFSRSSHPRLELPLTEGDTVHVLGIYTLIHTYI